MVTHHEVGEGSHNRDEDSDQRRAVGTPPYLAETMRSLMVELQRWKADNERMMKNKKSKWKLTQFYCRVYPIYKDKCSMNLKLRNRVISVATLKGSPRKSSTPEVKDKRRMIPLRRKRAIRRALLVAKPVPIPEGNRRRKSLLKVVNSKNSENPNHPPSTVK
jgi:hypothetical protein